MFEAHSFVGRHALIRTSSLGLLRLRQRQRQTGIFDLGFGAAGAVGDLKPQMFNPVLGNG